MVVHQKPTSDRLLRSIPLTAAIIGPLMSAAPLLAAPQLEEITVTATLQAEDGRRSAVTVFGRPFIDDRSAQHIEDLLSAAPNVNVASGGVSRSIFPDSGDR